MPTRRACPTPTRSRTRSANRSTSSRSNSVEGRPPNRNRGARTARLGRVAARGALNWAGDRLDSRGTPDEQRRRRGDRIVAAVGALVPQLGVGRGAARRGGGVLSGVGLRGGEEDQSDFRGGRLAPRRGGAPAVNGKDMRKALWGGGGEQRGGPPPHIETDPAA